MNTHLTSWTAAMRRIARPFAATVLALTAVAAHPTLARPAAASPLRPDAVDARLFTRQPRPIITGRVGQGSAPCTSVPADAGTTTVKLMQDDGNLICDSGDTDVVTTAGINPSTGWYAFPADNSAALTDDDPEYCVVVDRASGTDPAPVGPINPGVDPEATFTVDPICQQ